MNKSDYTNLNTSQTSSPDTPLCLPHNFFQKFPRRELKSITLAQLRLYEIWMHVEMHVCVCDWVWEEVHLFSHVLGLTDLTNFPFI